MKKTVSFILAFLLLICTLSGCEKPTETSTTAEFIFSTTEVTEIETTVQNENAMPITEDDVASLIFDANDDTQLSQDLSNLFGENVELVRLIEDCYEDEFISIPFGTFLKTSNGVDMILSDSNIEHWDSAQMHKIPNYPVFMTWFIIEKPDSSKCLYIFDRSEIQFIFSLLENESPESFAEKLNTAFPDRYNIIECINLGKYFSYSDNAINLESNSQITIQPGWDQNYYRYKDSMYMMLKPEGETKYMYFYYDSPYTGNEHNSISIGF